MTEEKTNYPIDERCKNCSLFQVVEDIKKQLKIQAEEITKLKRIRTIQKTAKELK